ncbi:GGDEF domain-containing protein [Viridibacterium curvum]|uniref:GGDEF domain-containing protein n=1 Tax=Viridibacterium curvum TaxID=1101404 RepID=UPI0031E6134A
MSRFQSWLTSNRIRARELGLLLFACTGAAVWLFILDAPGATYILPAATHVSQRPALMWGFTSLALALFAWRRWREIDALLEEAETDVLTGLHNRRMIESLLEREFDRAMRYGRPLSLILIDVDHFKRVNDTHGHAVGDNVLATLARRVQRRMRISDHFGRWGGEEFLLICPETDTTDAMLVADRLRKSIRHKPMRLVGTVTASFGVSTYTGQGDYTALIDEADHYLYAAKLQGRDRVISKFTLMAQDALRREGRADEAEQPIQSQTPSDPDRLSSVLSTIMAPLQRKRERRFGR